MARTFKVKLGDGRIVKLAQADKDTKRPSTKEKPVKKTPSPKPTKKKQNTAPVKKTPSTKQKERLRNPIKKRRTKLV